VADGWARVEALCAAWPRTLVHGDIGGKNVRVRGGVPGAELLVFDWEMAGLGIPAVDLLKADLDEYLAVARERWPELDRESLAQQRHVGLLLRGAIASIDWTALCLGFQWVEKPMRDLRIYALRLSEAMEKLGLA
jgi:aminoglycoside phosphotransferase (APT) family kinase protein